MLTTLLLLTLVSFGNCLVYLKAKGDASNTPVSYGPTVEPEVLDVLVQEKRFDLLHKITGVDHYNFTLLEGSSQYESMPFFEDLFHGDMLIPKVKDESRQGMKNLATRWPNRRIPYSIDSNYPSDLLPTIRSAISSWNSQVGSCVQLVERTNERDYVYVFNGQGCYSVLGKSPQSGPQELSLQAYGCTSRGTIQHEFFHAAGSVHEQMRPDRDKSVTVHFENIAKNWWSQWEKWDSDTIEAYSNYDCTSVMHYPRTHPAFSVDNKPAFTAKAGYTCDYSRTGQRDGFSNNDLIALRKMYCS